MSINEPKFFTLGIFFKIKRFKHLQNQYERFQSNKAYTSKLKNRNHFRIQYQYERDFNPIKHTHLN